MNKMFSLNEVKGMLFEIANDMRLKSINAYAEYFKDKNMVSNLVNKKLQSLQQTSWNVEVEMEELYLEENSMNYTHEKTDVSGSKLFPKKENNSIKITKIL